MDFHYQKPICPSKTIKLDIGALAHHAGGTVCTNEPRGFELLTTMSGITVNHDFIRVLVNISNFMIKQNIDIGLMPANG